MISKKVRTSVPGPPSFFSCFASASARGVPHSPMSPRSSVFLIIPPHFNFLPVDFTSLFKHRERSDERGGVVKKVDPPLYMSIPNADDSICGCSGSPFCRLPLCGLTGWLPKACGILFFFFFSGERLRRPGRRNWALVHAGAGEFNSTERVRLLRRVYAEE